MKKEIADKWVAALRSGKYIQGKEYLYNEKENSYCCLGVLCDILGTGTGEHNAKLDSYTMSLSGMRSKNGSYEVSYMNTKAYYTLAELNDIYMVSFDEIADIIEREWEQL